MKINKLFLSLALLVVLVSSSVAFAANIAPGQWIVSSGEWRIDGDTIISESPSNTNTNAYMQLAQIGPMMTYEWTVKFGETTVAFGPAAGMHFLGNDATNAFRGISYCVFQDKTFIRLYRTTGSALGKVGDFPTPEVSVGDVHSYKVTFDTTTGLLTIYRNGELVGSWTDKEPLTGNVVSLRAGGSVAEFSNVRITSGL
jgi:hypothetical protein